MTNEEQFLSAIDLIADKLGIAATEIFEIFVTAQTTIGIMMILQCITVTLLCVMTYFITMKLLFNRYTYHAAVAKAKAEDDYVSADDKTFVLVIPPFAAVISILVWGIIVDLIKAGMLKIMCPEYSSIIEIINLIK